MKKTLVALAAVSAVSAFAQVTITGNMDFAGAKVGGSQAWAMGSTFSQTVGVASTSVINIAAVEDIGGGTKVTAWYGLDPRTLANDAYAVTSNTGLANNYGAQAGATASAVSSAQNGATLSKDANSVVGVVAGQANTATGLSRDELYVGAAGSFGNIRLGSPNSLGLETFLNASPGGTGIGGGYTGGGTAGTLTNSFVQTRYNRSARYDSPVMSGFSASLMYIPGNDQAAATAANVTGSTGAVTPASVVPYAYLIPNARSGSEYGLKYANGPLTVMYTNISQGLQLNSTGYYRSGASTAGAKTSANYITAQYAMGNTTFYVGMNDGQRLAPIGSLDPIATNTVDSKGKRYAIKQVVGNVDLMATLTTQEALGVTNVTYAAPTSTTTATTAATQYTTSVLKAKVLGLRAQYNLSKTAAVYAGYEKYSTGAAYDATALGSTGDRTIASMGLRKSF